jgi:hypothetical protein
MGPERAPRGANGNADPAVPAGRKWLLMNHFLEEHVRPWPPIRS